jgi:hypothetical protein
MGAALVSGTSIAAIAAEPVQLRGYGKVSADLSPTRSVFGCESVEKADILLDKLQADLFWDETLQVTKSEVKLDAGPVTIYSVPGYGSALIARSGRQVIVLGGDNEKEVTSLGQREPLLKNDVTSKAAKSHPLYLDYFDNKAFTVNIYPMGAREGFDRDLMRSLGGGFNIMGPVFEMENPAPGVMNWTNLDFEMREAEARNDIVSIGPWAGPVPLWARNIDPDSLMQPSGTTVVGDWGGSFQAGANIESWTAPVAQRLRRGLGYQQSAIERYRSSPALGGWMIFAGSPGWEYGLGHGRAMNAWDASPVGQAGWRRWLQDECHYSLADLGMRWYGNAKHFASWEQVSLPDLNEFFGVLGPDSFRLTEGWRWQNLKGPATNAIDSKDPGWIPINLAPSQEASFLPRTGLNYYDIALNPGDWLKKQAKGSDVWLVVGFIGSTPVWLNGQPLQVPEDEASRNSSFAIRVTELVKPGVNHLQIAVAFANCFQNCGQLAGPVFLTTHEPKRFPYLGKQANARFADLINWRAWAVTDYHRQLVRLVRKLDPDRSFVLSGGRGNLFDYGDQLCAEFGMSQQNTGREAGYRPWSPASGLAGGYYGTSEFSAAPKGTSLDQGFAWTMIDADSRHNLCGDVTEYMRREIADGWYTKHKRQINLFGKYLREQPQVALLYSGQSHRFSPIGYSDIGVDALPASHYDQVYVSEIGLKTGLADPYPVLFDIGNQFMDPADVTAIQKYVTRGGSFIALDNSGLHTGIDPNSYPLSRISGFKPSERRIGKLRFESRLPIFKGWENREFEARGMSIAPISSDDATIPLARWNDGSIAIGYRRIGKGRIVTLGCQLWKEARDLSGTWNNPADFQRGFFSQLFADCGVTRSAHASTPDIWARKMVTKNGLQNWLMAFNTKADPQEANVWMAVDGKPDQVIDLDTNIEVPFVVENQGITIKDVQFNPFAIKTFAVRRATLAGALPVWWYEKTRYWKRTAAEIEAASMRVPPLSLVQDESVLPISQWRFVTDADQTIVSQEKWTSLGFGDADWQTKEAGPWNLFDPKLKDYHGTGLYRARFTVPPAWEGRRVLLNLYSFTDPIVYDTGEFFVNGTRVATYQAHGWNQTYNYDVTELVHAGENVLALKAIGGAQRGGLGGSVWIEARPLLRKTQDLSGIWRAVKGDWLTAVDLEIPNPAAGITAKYLTREVRIPVEWKGKDIFIEWTSKAQWVGAVMINGRPINYNSSAHPYGMIARVNVNPFIKPGENNVIQLWPFKTMTWSGTTLNPDADRLQLDAIRIGCRE